MRFKRKQEHPNGPVTEGPSPVPRSRGRLPIRDLPPMFHSIGLIALGILPFALFVFLASKPPAPAPAPVDQAAEAAMNSPLVPLAFPFGEPQEPPAPPMPPEPEVTNLVVPAATKPAQAPK
ncbi:MAG TPA: hypothetical protein VM754_12080, partial [Actinomycetota bacterium]|nr:hypothetical protein [Actinomycetota bacterium]